MGGCCSCCCGDGFTYTLRVNMLKAEGLPKMDFWSQSDGYVKVTYNGKTQRTKVVDDTANPVWNEILEFRGAKLGEDNLLFRVYDSDTLSFDDYIGETRISEELPPDYNIIKEYTLPINDKTTGKERGKLYLRLEFVQQKTA